MEMSVPEKYSWNIFLSRSKKQFSFQMKSKEYSATAFSIHWVYWVPSIPPKAENYSFQFQGFFCYVSQ